MGTQTTVEHRVCLRQQAELRRDAAGGTVRSAAGSITVAGTDPALLAALDALAGGPVDPATIEAAALRAAGFDAAAPGPDAVPVLARVQLLLRRMNPALCHTLTSTDGDLLRVLPLAAAEPFEPVPPRPEPVRLSRFARLGRAGDGDVLVLESGLAPVRVEVASTDVLPVLAALAAPTTVPDVAARTGLDEDTVSAIVGFLAGAGMTDAADADARTWNEHELYFHSRSRLGRHDAPFGATFPFLGSRPPLPALKPVPAGPAVTLFRPDLADLVRTDPPLVLAQEGRRSVRGYGRVPMSLHQLGEFLYRVGRIRAVSGPDAAAAMPYEAVDRPYPTGGATGDLEIYVTANRVPGLDRAAYYYDAREHRLVRVCTDARLVAALLGGAVRSAAGSPAPDALLTFTSRFGRLMWKYDGIAYAATLKHVGVAYQTCYLVATAMGLAPCALGSGDAHLAARAFGVAWHEESSVGEFMLGSRPDPVGDGDEVPGAPPVARWRPGNDPQWSVVAARTLAERWSR